MTKAEATKKVERLEAEVKEAKENFNYWFGLVDDMEQNGEPCDYEKEELELAKGELEQAKANLADAIDFRDNWC